MPRGFCTLVGARDREGREVSLAEAVSRGWVTPGRRVAGFDLPDDEVPLGPNLFLDNARQYTAYALAFRNPISDYTIQRFGVGTGVTPPNVTESALVNPVALEPGVYTKLIDGVDFPAPFTANFRFTIPAADANGYLLTEFGLFSGDETLMMRWVTPGINKTSDWSPTLLHRVVF